MLILKLAYSEDLTFSRDLQELRELLKKKDILIGFVESIEGNTHIIKIISEDECYNEKIKEVINLYVSNILYRIVIDNYRKKEMFEFITDNYFFLKQSEILEVEDQIVKVLKYEETTQNEDSIYCLNKINSMVEMIRDCISEKQELNIDGFITFRMRKLRSDIEKIIDKVVERYMVEKEYKEFIKLLKYFVELQECKIEEVNIIIEEGNNYIIRDKEGKNLYYDFCNEVMTEQNKVDLNIEDILISGLITNAPKAINIFGKENCNNKEFLDTIENVFENRVTFYEANNEYNSEKIIAKKYWHVLTKMVYSYSLRRNSRFSPNSVNSTGWVNGYLFMHYAWCIDNVETAIWPSFYYVCNFSEVKNINKDFSMNEEIREKELRVIGSDGEQLGVISSAEARRLAEEKEMDLVMISPNATPPVCKIMDFGKYIYEQSKKEKEAKKKQKIVSIKEIRCSLTIEEHDIDIKAKNARKFLLDGDKVKITVRFRGREMELSHIGQRILNNFASKLEDVCLIEKHPKREGRSMTMVLGPKKA